MLDPQAGAAISGDASVAPGNTVGTTVIIIALKGGTPGASYPWYLQSGQCGGGGAVVGASDAYPVLVVGSDGTAHATALIPVVPVMGPYDVVVGASPSDMSTAVSCGDLKASAK